MTEKRFMVIDDGFVKYIEDTTLTEDKHKGHIYDAYELCRELNRLCEENEQLKQKVDFYKYFQKDARELEKENEKLKQSNSQLARVNREGVKKVQKLSEENEKLKKQNKYKQPSCEKCTYFSTDGIGNYCMNEKSLLGEKGEMFPFTWNYKKGAKECKQYNDEKKLLNELINLIKNIIFEAKYEQSYSSPICQVSFFVTPEMYKILSEKLREINNDI